MLAKAPDYIVYHHEGIYKDMLHYCLNYRQLTVTAQWKLGLFELMISSVQCRTFVPSCTDATTYEDLVIIIMIVLHIRYMWTLDMYAVMVICTEDSCSHRCSPTVL